MIARPTHTPAAAAAPRQAAPTLPTPAAADANDQAVVAMVGPRTWFPKHVPSADYRVTRNLPYTGPDCVEWLWCLQEAARIHGQPARTSFNPTSGREVEIPERVAEARHTATSCAVFANRVARYIDDAEGDLEKSDGQEG